MIEKLCPRCRAAPLREVVDGVFRCAGCRLTPNACVCKPAVGGALDDYLEAEA